MLNKILSTTGIIALFALTLFTSCNKEATTDLNTTTTEAFTDASLSAMQRDASTGPYGCFEFVFPITIEFEDETTQTVNDYDELKAAVKAWKEANPDAMKRPNLVFPLEVISEDGSLISIADKEALFTLKKSCANTYPGPGHHGHGQCNDPCFDINFPLNIAFPDGTTAEVADRVTLKTTIRAWKEANPDATEKPEVVFPVSVTMEADGSVVEVNSREELKALKESCQ